MPDTPRVRVSVIVPVFRPGDGFDALIASLDDQTLDDGSFEVILCDDGSGEPTRARLAEVARTRPYVRVLTLPHTGWPGTPRNHGVEEARGEYVFFADQDDRLPPGALQHLCDYADQNASDVVVGRVVGDGRRIPQRIFRRDVPQATLGEDPLLELLTPHKLFRTAFLREHAIRFPDGRVRLEDHLFVMEAYFRARTVSILASEPCYVWVKEPGSASSSRIEPESYFPHLEAVLDLVEDNVPPGALRDTLLRHWYRGKVLKRIDAPRMLRYPAEYRERFLDVVVPLAQRRFGPGVEEGLALPLRVRSALLRADRRDELLRLAEFESALECVADVTAARWTRRGTLVLDVRVRVQRDGRNALSFAAAPGDDVDAGRVILWDPPADLIPEALPPETRLAAGDLARDRLDVDVQDGASARRAGGKRLTRDLTARFSLDPLRLFADDAEGPAGGPLVARVRRAGWTFEVPLRAERDLVAATPASPFLAGRRCRLVAGADGLELRRDGRSARWRDRAARAVRRTGSSVRRGVRRLRPAT